MISHMTNKEILKRLDKVVHGHRLAKKTLITVLNRSRMRYLLKYRGKVADDKLLNVSHCMLVGGSGTGKTYMLEQLQKMLKFPILKIDATDLMPTGGGKGGVKSADIYENIAKQAHALLDTHNEFRCSINGIIDQTVVFIDEIDKLATSQSHDGAWQKHTQSNFLSLFDDVALKGVTFIFAGAFTDLTYNKLLSKSIGFNNANTAGDNNIKSGEELDEDIIKYGLITELVGRISNIVQLDSLRESDYKQILKNNLLPEVVSELAYFGILNLKPNKDFLDSIIKKAISSGQGIRSLKRDLNRYILDLEFNYENKLEKLLGVSDEKY